MSKMIPFFCAAKIAGIDLAVEKLLAAAAGVGVRIDVPRTEILLEELLDRANAGVAEVDHDRDVGDLPRLFGLDVGVPLRSAVVRALHADDDALVLERKFTGDFPLHVLQVVLDLAASHAVADDVEEGEDAGAGLVDDPCLEIFEVAPAGAAGVGNGGRAAFEREAVRRDAAESARVALALAGVDVDVDVDETGRDVKAGDIDGLRGLCRRDVGLYRGDFAVFDAHVAHGIDRVPAVDDMSTLQQNVVGGLRVARLSNTQRQ